MILFLSDFASGESPSQVLTLIQEVGTLGGLNWQGWAPQGMLSTVWNLAAQRISAIGSYVQGLALGGTATNAANILGANGQLVTGWLDLVGQAFFRTQRHPATFANGPVLITNSGSTVSYAAGQYRLTNTATGATYANQSAITIPGAITVPQPFGSPITIPYFGNFTFVADVPGSASTTPAGVTLSPATPVPGITIGPTQDNGIVGQDAESNQAYLQRCYAFPGTFSAGGPASGYYYAAASAVTASGNYASRVLVQLQKYSGVVAVYLGYPGGGANADLIAAVKQALLPIVPFPVQSAVLPATQHLTTVSGTLVLPASLSGIANTSAILASAETAATNYAGSIPIGGVVTHSGAPGILPLSALVSALVTGSANSLTAAGLSTQGVYFDISSPVVDINLPANAVPVVSYNLGAAFG
jgi:hypothetical protein